MALIPLPPAPKPLVYVGVTLASLALLPPAIVARVRAMPSDRPRVHLVQDMDNQSKYKAQAASTIFADGRAMRPPVAGAIARGSLPGDDHVELGWAGGAWTTTFPREVTVNMAFLERGRERFNIYCTPCHGAAGYGDGMVSVRAMELVNNPAIGNGTAWVQPKNIHEPEIRVQPVGQVYNTITNGIRTMAGYGSQIPILDRWAIAGYVKALQRSQSATTADVPGGRADALELRDLRPVEGEEGE